MISKKLFIVSALIIFALGGLGLEFALSNKASTQISKGEPKAVESNIKKQPTVPQRNFNPSDTLGAKSFSMCTNFFERVCAQKHALEDPTGGVQPDVKGEIDALRVYETVIHKHHGWTSDQVTQELVRLIYTPRRVRILRETFAWVQNEVIKFIERQPPGVFSLNEKLRIVNDIRRTQLELPPPASIYADETGLFTKNDVYYQQTMLGKKRLRIGGAYLLSARSWFNRVFTLAHELTHSVDPCEMRQNKVFVAAYQPLEQCFIQHGFIKENISSPVCGDDDQFPEAFADWVASNVLSEALVRAIDKFQSYKDRENAVINSVKDLCDQGESWVEADTRLHPNIRQRVELIFGGNPEVRRFLDCEANPRASDYCFFSNPVLGTWGK